MTVEVSEAMRGVPGTGDTAQKMTVEVRNTGWYLFDCLPLICGDPQRPDAVSCRFFSDTLTLQNNLTVLSEVIEREKASVLGSIVSHEEGEGFLTFVVTRQSYHTSATLMLPGGEGRPNKK
jgi:hypothetical protein